MSGACAVAYTAAIAVAIAVAVAVSIFLLCAACWRNNSGAGGGTVEKFAWTKPKQQQQTTTPITTKCTEEKYPTVTGYDIQGSWKICKTMQGGEEVGSRNATGIQKFRLTSNQNPFTVSFELKFTGVSRYDIYIIRQGSMQQTESSLVRLLFYDFKKRRDGEANFTVGGLNNYRSTVTRTSAIGNTTSKTENSNLTPGTYYALININNGERRQISDNVVISGGTVAPGAQTQPKNITCNAEEQIPSVNGYDHTGKWRTCSVNPPDPLRIVSFRMIKAINKSNAITFQLSYEGACGFEVYIDDPKNSSYEIRLKWNDFGTRMNVSSEITIGNLGSYTSSKRNKNSGASKVEEKQDVATMLLFKPKPFARAYIYSDPGLMGDRKMISVRLDAPMVSTNPG
jgi:hypothetical protein